MWKLSNTIQELKSPREKITKAVKKHFEMMKMNIQPPTPTGRGAKWAAHSWHLGGRGSSFTVGGQGHVTKMT